METKLSSDLASTAEEAPGIPPPAEDAPARVDETGVELKRGMFFNTIAMLASIFVIALIPAIFCRALLSGIVGQVTSTAAFLAVFGALWLRHHWHRGPRQHYNANQKS